MGEDFFLRYFSYASNNEAPKIFHRWCAIAGLGAFLGRQFFLSHGHFTVYPNIYCMLIGTSGARKSTSIRIMRKILVAAGYANIAANKSSKEKFLLDLAGEKDEVSGQSAESFLSSNLFDTSDQAAEMFVMADEFNVFTGQGNLEFIDILGDLWDYEGVYTQRLKNSKSVAINNPTVSILGGNTPTNLAKAFPPEVFGQGFFSRMILIYGEPNGQRITFPKPPTEEATNEIVKHLRELKAKVFGSAILTSAAEKLLEKIYINTTRTIDDIRFEPYCTRRLNHLLKLCLIHSASVGTTKIDERIVIQSNTILTFTEKFMSKALGEFGKAKHSDISHRIVQFIESQEDIVVFKDLWIAVRTDLEKPSDLATLLQNLVMAEKIQQVAAGKSGGKAGFLPRRKVINYQDSSTLDYSYLTEEERKLAL